MRSQQAPPRAQLPQRQGLLLGGGDLDGCDGRHGGPVQQPAQSNIAAPARARSADRFHRRVARHAHSIISGCSGSRPYSAQRGILRKRSRLARHVHVRRKHRRQQRRSGRDPTAAASRHQHPHAAGDLRHAADLTTSLSRRLCMLRRHDPFVRARHHEVVDAAPPTRSRRERPPTARPSASRLAGSCSSDGNSAPSVDATLTPAGRPSIKKSSGPRSTSGPSSAPAARSPAPASTVGATSARMPPCSRSDAAVLVTISGTGFSECCGVGAAVRLQHVVGVAVIGGHHARRRRARAPPRPPHPGTRPPSRPPSPPPRSRPCARPCPRWRS